MTASTRTTRTAIDRKPRSIKIKAQRTVDAEFLTLLRGKCMRAASIGALTAITESIPGSSRVLGFVFGELLDAKFLANVQRELIEDTFKLYGLELPALLHAQVVGKIQLIGTSASMASDAVVRQLLRQIVGRVGSVLARRVLPLAAIVSSALSNATVTYAIGKRAQAVARLRDGPITGMPDVVRAFSGIDERRVFQWSLEAVKGSLGTVGNAIRRVSGLSGKPWSRKRKTATE